MKVKKNEVWYVLAWRIFYVQTFSFPFSYKKTSFSKKNYDVTAKWNFILNLSWYLADFNLESLLCYGWFFISLLVISSLVPVCKETIGKILFVLGFTFVFSFLLEKSIMDGVYVIFILVEHHLSFIFYFYIFEIRILWRTLCLQSNFEEVLCVSFSIPIFPLWF